VLHEDGSTSSQLPFDFLYILEYSVHTPFFFISILSEDSLIVTAITVFSVTVNEYV